ncbi:MAG: TolC family protein [Alphaproteobacteria bacterium]|nr:TolC family protein [Alphaproteobacteria bacterium]
MKTSLRTILLLALSAISLSLRSQAPMELSLRSQAPMELSLDSAIEYAIRYNKTLINSRYAIDKSTQAIRQAIAAGLPQASATVNYTDYLGATASIQLSESMPASTIKFTPSSDFKVSVSQLIFNGNYYIGVQLSKLAKKMTEQSYLNDELDVKEQTIQAYYLVLANERILNIIRENKANAQLILEKTTNLVNAGILEETDMKKLSVMVTTVDNQIKSTERELELGYNLLRLHLGLESQQAVKLTSDLDQIALRYIFNASVTDTFNIQNNVNYQMILTRKLMAKKNIQMQKSSYLPTLAAYYSYTEKIKKPLFDISPKNVLGVTMNIPILSGGQRFAQLKQAKIEYDMSENSKALLSQQLTIQERQLRYNYQNLYEQYLNQKTNKEVAREVLDKMNLKYQQGVISTLELTSANTDYLNAETNFTNVLMLLLNAELTLRKTNNKL